MMEENDLVKARLEKLGKIREMGINAYPYAFKNTAKIEDVRQKYDETAKETPTVGKVRVAGRIMFVRSFGKAAFFDLKDVSSHIQIYIRKGEISDAEFRLFKLLDIGDIVGVEGRVFKTRTGELTVYADILTLLNKALYPLPEKWHGLKDKELRYRKRYLDLIMNDDSRKIFFARSRIINFIRNYLARKGFFEVETPVLQPLIGGAAAKPFITHHNALDMDLYMRIAPELYLKRLIVGGLEKVFELGRNFRNEGMDLRHNPEFTMVEIYQAYADYNDMMDLMEDLLRTVARDVLGEERFDYLGSEIDLRKPFTRITLRDAILSKTAIDIYKQTDKASLGDILKKNDIEFDGTKSYAKLTEDIFERFVQSDYISPTFVIDYPREMSPLAKAKRDNDSLSERFEFFIGGREMANAYSEQSDPQQQYEAFKKQVQEREEGDDEAMLLDDDYVSALCYGMPPTGGLGIGIDRLVMLLANTESIRDVILFPQMKIKK